MSDDLKPWWVMSPEYDIYPQTEIEPPEYGKDCIPVFAKNKRDALAFAIKIMRKQTSSYISGDTRENSFSDLEVQSAICHHGIPHFTETDGYDQTIGCDITCMECWKEEKIAVPFDSTGNPIITI